MNKISDQIHFSELPPPPPFPQGELAFVEELKKYDPRKVHWNSNATIPANCFVLQGKWQIAKDFPDPENLLETAYDALLRFAENNINQTIDNKVVIKTVPNRRLAPEEYIIDIAPAAITLASADTEGIRRAVYKLIEMCRSSAIPALEYQTVKRKPWLKNRISRCFFAPIKRPPFFRDELLDNVDYYPDSYLDRLAAEAVNGIWLTITWKELADTQFFPIDPQRGQRIAKLQSVVAKCRRYGIKVWVFCIEPASWSAQTPPPYQDMQGECNFDNILYSFCIASENSQHYIRSSVSSIFSAVPDLGGMMLISLGERATSCLSYIYDDKAGKLACNEKCGFTHSRILGKVLENIRLGIADAGSKAEVLSWLYNPRVNEIPRWWFTLPEDLSRSDTIAFNFESGCTKTQAGKECCGGDYWLSCIGPADRFIKMAQASQNRCAIAAKLQVGCSHELATIPFMPVPGNLYQKYKAMKELGVSSVIQCWYFGNYPGTMNQAAGALAFEDFSGTQTDFLRQLAMPEWGYLHADKIAELWNQFSESYSNYPLDIQFQYYGPMHDGIVWPLYLKQEMRSLPRSWKPDAAPAGDAIGEALNNHTLDSAAALTGVMAEKWHNALALLPELRENFAGDPARLQDCNLYEALDLLFDSGAGILQFYKLRDELFRTSSSRNILQSMLKLIQKEISNSRRMIDLCNADPRLGYHSEAEVFKFYPAKLQWRIDSLKNLSRQIEQLANMEYPEIKSILMPEDSSFITGIEYNGGTFRWRADVNEEFLTITISNAPLPADTRQEAEYIYLMDAHGVKFPLEFAVVHTSGTPNSYSDKYRGITTAFLPDGSCTVAIPLSKIDFADEVFFGILRCWVDRTGKFHTDITPAGEYVFEQRLNFAGYFSPDKTRRLILKKSR